MRLSALKRLKQQNKVISLGQFFFKLFGGPRCGLRKISYASTLVHLYSDVKFEQKFQKQYLYLTTCDRYTLIIIMYFFTL